jgi:hypothetical protein
MHDDPVVYAVRNHGSRVTVLAMIAVMLAAHFMPLSLIPPHTLTGSAL